MYICLSIKVYINLSTKNINSQYKILKIEKELVIGNYKDMLLDFHWRWMKQYELFDMT